MLTANFIGGVTIKQGLQYTRVKGGIILEQNNWPQAGVVVYMILVMLMTRVNDYAVKGINYPRLQVTVIKNNCQQ